MKYWCLIFLVAFFIYLPGTNRPLRDAEAKYAEIPREMLTLGDWLTPHLDYTRYFVKPPLTFWTTAFLYRTFGVNERNAQTCKYSDERPELEHIAILNFYTGHQVFLLRNNKNLLLHFIQKDREAMCLNEADLKRMVIQKLAVYLVGETGKTEQRLTRMKISFAICSSSGNRSFFRLERTADQEKKDF